MANIRVPVLTIAVACLAEAVAAQCQLQWAPGDGVPGLGSQVYAIASWDPDGSAPAPSQVALGGAFVTAGTMLTNHIALWDPASATFSALGGGVDGDVRALAVAANGELVVGGAFTQAGGGAASNIALWNGTNWAPLGTGLNGAVHALLSLPNGDLIAGGSFTAAGSTTTQHVARWDGASWSAMGTGLQHALPFPATVFALALLANGDVVAGGSFTQAGGVPTSLVAKWDGVSWSALGAGLPASNFFDSVQALAVLPNGTLYAGGQLVGGYGFLQRWNGTTWTSAASFSGGFDNVQVASLVARANGDLIVGGAFSVAGGTGANLVARWDGTSWSGLGTGMSMLFPTLSISPVVTALAELPTGDLIAGGNFTVAGGMGATSAARWNGTAWAPLGNGIQGYVAAVATMPNGDLVVGGSFLSVGNVQARRIARWNGAIWSALGTGLNDTVTTLAILPNGDLVAGGLFTSAGGVPTTFLARWTGSTWAPLGTGTGGHVSRLLVRANGNLVAAGSFTSAGGVAANGVAQWDGSTWSSFGGGVTFGSSVYSLAELPNGDLVAAGVFASAGGTPANNIARWNGSSWSPLGTGISGSLVALAALPTGDLVAAGWFTSAGGVAANGIARWDGANWSALGGGITGGAGFTGCSALFVLPNGDLAAAASYNLVPSGTVVANTVSRWNGSVWSTMASGISGSVYAMQMTALGELAIGGSFPIAGGHVTGPLARLSSTCPATVASFGAGCTGTGGLNTLRALTLPWLGSTYRAIAAGIAPNSLAIGVHGLGQVSLPLLSVLPTAGPGCSLFVSPDVLALLVPTGTTVQDQLTVPATAALVGQRVQHQVVPLVFDVSGNLSAVTSTNALSLTIGSF